MKYCLEEIKNKEIWDGLVSKSADDGFLYSSWSQLWLLGDLARKAYSASIYRILLKRDNVPVLMAEIIKCPLFFPLMGFSFLHIASGPIVIKGACEEHLGPFISKLEEISGLLKDALFLKMELPWLYSGSLENFLNKSGFVKSVTAMGLSSNNVAFLRLDRDISAIMSSMNQATRRQVKIAAAKGVTVRKAGSGQDFDLFWTLYQRTAKRKNFYTKPYSWCRGIYELSDDFGLSSDIFIAEYQGRAVAALLAQYYRETAFYTFGGTDIQEKVSPLKLLIWHSIKEAKNRGCVNYNLGHIDEKKLKDLIQFKNGFGAEEARYVGTYDYYFRPLDKWLSKLIRTIKQNPL